jgi:hypothetical protein
MSLITAEGERGQGYQAVPLPRPPGDGAVLTAAMVRRSCARRSTRAVLYVHCLSDPYVQPDLPAWYLERGFHFYVADLRAARPRSREATLAEYFGYLDSACRRVRDTDGNRVVLVSAHQAGAVIAALWCHARRGHGSPDALILADPDFGPGQHWLARLLAVRQPGPAAAGARAGAEQRPADVLARAQRKVRRGLDISCPVLMMSPSAVNAAVPGAAGRAVPPARLGPHVTSLRLASVPGVRAWPDARGWADARPWPDAWPRPAGQAGADRAARPKRHDELSRWLGAYISADVRDQLL